jgi:hypothetical protein
MDFVSRTGRRPVWRVLRASFVTLLVVLVLAGGAAAFDTWAFADSLAEEERLLPGTTVGGVDVGGMRADDARRLVEEPLLNRPLVVRFEGRSWTLTPRELGSTTDVAEAVGRAERDARAAGWAELARIRWFDETHDHRTEVAVHASRDAIEAFVADIAKGIDVSAVDAVLDYDDGWVTIHDARQGRRLDREAAPRGIEAAITAGGSSVDLATITVEPEVTRADFAQVLLLRKSDFRVYLYEDGEITSSWPVAIGRPDAPTPTGVFEVGTKRRLPTWVNPAPTGWGRDMPRRIGPGPSNPLGLRALNWHTHEGRDTLIRFHGTPNTASIGNPASQGCVRLTNPDVVDLFDRVATGATIVSLPG